MQKNRKTINIKYDNEFNITQNTRMRSKYELVYTTIIRDKWVNLKCEKIVVKCISYEQIM